MIVLAVLALGFVSVRSLAVDLFPEIDLPVAVVATSYQDAAPEEIESSISKPLEESISSVEGIETIQSQSHANSSLVLMMFKNGTELEQSLDEKREVLDQVSGMIHERASDLNIMRYGPGELPVVYFSFTGIDADVLDELADNEVVLYFARQEGVESVTV